jgi:hypothetical protein
VNCTEKTIVPILGETSHHLHIQIIGSLTPPAAIFSHAACEAVLVT